MRTHTRALALAASLTLALTACGGGDDAPAAGDDTGSASTMESMESTEGGEMTEPMETEDGGDAGAAAGDTVSLSFFAFDPEELTVSAGSTVTWVNEDDVRHTVTAGTPDAPETDRFDLDLPANGDTVTFTFDEAGTYAYFCDVHKSMTATIVVE
ncbi:MAG: plastocyanin/azurin family copper-binding protein [Actinomycetes bacterium]